jgi:hypothetical protein
MNMSYFWITLFLLTLIVFSGIYLWLVMRHREKVKLINAASYIILGTAFFIILHIIGLMLFPVKIQEVEYPVKVLNPNHEVRRGESVVLQVTLKKYVDKPSTIYPNILCNNGYYYTYPERKSNVPMGEQTIVIANNYTIAPDAPIGSVCKTRSTDVFNLNIFRDKTFVHESEEFTIIE